MNDWKDITVHSEAEVAKVTPALISQELTQNLINNHGMMFPVGHCANVGLREGGGGYATRGYRLECPSMYHPYPCGHDTLY